MKTNAKIRRQKMKDKTSQTETAATEDGQNGSGFRMDMASISQDTNTWGDSYRSSHSALMFALNVPLELFDKIMPFR